MDRVWQVSAHKNLPFLAACGSDACVRIYSLPNLALQATLRSAHTRSVRSVSWRPAEHGSTPTIASASFDGKTAIWALEGESQLPTGGWEFIAQLEGHDNEVKCAAWSPDGQFLATCSRDKSVWIWEVDPDTEDFDCVAVLQDHTQDVKHVVWHPREELLASTSYDESIRLWKRDDDEWVCVCDLQQNFGTVWGCDFEQRAVSEDDSESYYTSHDEVATTNNRLVACYADGKLRIFARSDAAATGKTQEDGPRSWHVPSQEWAQTFELPGEHNGAAYSVKWLVSGEIVSVGADGTIILQAENDDGEWAVVQTIEKAHGLTEINTISALGSTLFTGGDDGCIRVWRNGQLDKCIEYSDLYRPFEPAGGEQMEFEVK